MTQFHTPVLLQEAIHHLNIQPDQTYIDATLGGGGHTRQILQQGGRVIAFDVDQEAINHVKETQGDHPHLTLINANFSHLAEELDHRSIKSISGALFDFGVSTWQLTQPHRGFTFSHNTELDMRMDQNLSVTAKDLLAALGEKELATIFTRYGDEPKSRQIAKTIVQVRKNHPITNADHLAGIIERLYPPKKHKLHPATKVFQALRIAVNDEIGEIEAALPQAFKLLKPEGRLVTISFHSGEDRIAKHFFKQLSNQNLAQLITKKPIQPTNQEISTNPSSRSAKLRAIQKL